MGRKDSVLYLDNLDSPILSPTLTNLSSTERFNDDIPPSALAERIFNDPGAWEISPYFETGHTDDGFSGMNFEQEMEWMERETRKAVLEAHNPQDTDNKSNVIPWTPESGAVVLTGEAQIRDPTQEEEDARGMRPISLSGIFDFNCSDLSVRVDHMKEEKDREQGIRGTVFSPPSSEYSDSSSSNSESSTTGASYSQLRSHLHSRQRPTLPLPAGDPNKLLLTPCILSASLTSPFNVCSASTTLSFLEWHGIYPESPMVSQINKALSTGLHIGGCDQITSRSRTPAAGNVLGLSLYPSGSQELDNKPVAPKSILEKGRSDIKSNGAVQVTFQGLIIQGEEFPSTPTSSANVSAFGALSRIDSSTLPQTPPRPRIHPIDIYNTRNSASTSTSSTPSNSSPNNARRLPSLPINTTMAVTSTAGGSLKSRTPYTGNKNATGDSEEMVVYTPPYTSITRPMPTPECYRPSPPSSTSTHHSSNCNSDTPSRLSSSSSSYISKENRNGNVNENGKVGANLERTSSTPNRSLKYRVRARPRRNFSGTEGFISARECPSSYGYGYKKDISTSGSGFKESSLPAPAGPRDRKGCAGLGTPTRSSGAVHRDYWSGIKTGIIGTGTASVGIEILGSADVNGTLENRDEKEDGSGVTGVLAFGNESYVHQWITTSGFSKIPLR